MAIDWSRVITVEDEETVNLIAGKTVLYFRSGSIVSVEWGDITGSLSDQTDLQNALNAKAATSSLGAMAFEADAPSDSKTYGRKNGAWSEITGGGSSTEFASVTYFVDGVNGDDNNPGTALAPFATIQAAVDATPFNASGTVYVVSGTYGNVSVEGKTISIIPASEGASISINKVVAYYNAIVGIGGIYTGTISIGEIFAVDSIIEIVQAVTAGYVRAFGGKIFSPYSTLTVNATGSVAVKAEAASHVYLYNAVLTADTGVLSNTGSIVIVSTITGTMTTQTSATNGGRVYVGNQ